MKLAYLPIAQKQLSKLSRSQKIKVVKTIRKLALNPFAGKSLGGRFAGHYSARAWPYRIIYRFLKQTQLLIIETIQHRQQVYK